MKNMSKDKLMILITGLLPYESGKTSFALELISALKEIGIKVTPFKPIGSHNAWYQYKTLINSIKHGILIGEDAYKLAKITGKLNEIELISPLDILIAPPEPIKYIETDTISYLMDLYTNTFKQSVIMRETKLINDNCETKHYIIKENYENTVQPLKRKLDKLVNKLENAKLINYDTFISKISNLKTYQNIGKILQFLYMRDNYIIIESFNNAALPILEALKSNYVFIVMPGRILLYKGRKYERTLKIIGNYENPLTIETRTIASLCKPDKIFPWKPKVKSKLGISKTVKHIASLIIK